MKFFVRMVLHENADSVKFKNSKFYLHIYIYLDRSIPFKINFKTKHGSRDV